MNEKERWNRLANHYQSVLHEEKPGGYVDQLIAYLAARGALKPTSRIADIGCGTGKYALRFAERGCSLLLLDLAENMMNHTLSNLKNSEAAIESAVGDWSKIDLTASGWTKSVDLAFAAMTPAVKDVSDIEKLSTISARYCFISRFAQVNNPLQDALYAACSSDAAKTGFEQETWLDAIRQVYELGFFPELSFRSYDWENQLTAEQAEERFFDGYGGSVCDTTENRKKVRLALAHFADSDGVIYEKVQTKVAWIFWDVTDRRQIKGEM